MTRQFDAVFVGGGPRTVATIIRMAARLAHNAEEPARTRAGAGNTDTGSTDTGSADAVSVNADSAAAGSSGRQSTAPARPLRIAIVDALEVGSGATWLTTQPAQYLNNTTASATTLYPDESTPMSGPPSRGPDLVTWMQQVAEAGTHPAGDWVVEEAGVLRALDFTSRRLQGVYYRDQLDHAIAAGGFAVEEFVTTVVDLEAVEVEPYSGDPLTAAVLADGTRLAAPTVVLAQGMVQSLPDAEVEGLTRFAADHDLRYVPPGMPAERDFTGLPAGETVLVRGLGANFFDVIGGLLAEWGGTFEPVADDPHGRLRYVPTGREPHLVIGSRRGMPYRTKPIPYSQQRDFTPRWATPAWFDALAQQHSLDFGAEVWPTIAKEIADQYLTALAGWAPHALAAGTPATGTSAAGVAADGTAADGPWVAELDAAATAEDVERVLADHVIDERWAWTIADLRRPTRGRSVTPEEWDAFVATLVEDELASMSEPARHPRAAVNRAMSLLRGSAQRLGAVGAVSGESLVRDLQGWFDADGLFLASGPPAVRVRKVLALIDAGIIDLLGPESVVRTDPDAGRFRAQSLITQRSVEASALVETRMSKGRVPHTDNPLLRSLLDSGRARIHQVDGVQTDYIEATRAEIAEAAPTGHNLVASTGEADESVIVLGIPASTTQPGSAIGATPGLPSPLLAGADVAAKQVLRRAGRGAQQGLGWSADQGTGRAPGRVAGNGPAQGGRP
ncbi:FAD/NAD(P)-binding protein [Brevibacterium yomogidense]|uniref:FAD/NAD(P)-binding protein n=1 Tax=Brevibacterium yomogidense TaxID=946573 RepID=UPI002FCD03A5